MSMTNRAKCSSGSQSSSDGGNKNCVSRSTCRNLSLMENLPVQGVSGFDEFNIFYGLKVRQTASIRSMLKIRVNGTASCHSHQARNRRSGHSTSRCLLPERLQPRIPVMKRINDQNSRINSLLQAVTPMTKLSTRASGLVLSSRLFFNSLPGPKWILPKLKILFHRDTGVTTAQTRPPHARPSRKTIIIAVLRKSGNPLDVC